VKKKTFLYENPELYGKTTTEVCVVYLLMKFVTHFAVLVPHSTDSGHGATRYFQFTAGIKGCIPFIKYPNKELYLKPIKCELSLYTQFPKDPFQYYLPDHMFVFRYFEILKKSLFN
jgi:hypothetical protein